jgi:hypothetical protein
MYPQRLRQKGPVQKNLLTYIALPRTVQSEVITRWCRDVYFHVAAGSNWNWYSTRPMKQCNSARQTLDKSNLFNDSDGRWMRAWRPICHSDEPLIPSARGPMGGGVMRQGECECEMLAVIPRDQSTARGTERRLNSCGLHESVW